MADAACGAPRELLRARRACPLVGERGELPGDVGSTVAAMTSSWNLSLSLDARGHDDTHVSVVRERGGGSPHVKVRVGGVVVHCLDGAAVMSAARAWAAARLGGQDWRPPIRNAQGQPDLAGLGAAYPVGSIIFEGRQQWQASNTGAAIEVTVGPLLVRARDMTALDTHVRAWTEASALACRVYPGKSVPFARLVEQQRLAVLRALDAQQGRRPARRANGRPSGIPPRAPSDLGRGRE